jgi:hypothetical protein
MAFEPGVEVAPHKHAGNVHAFTFPGQWGYLEYPDCPPDCVGSYLFEPADVLFVIYGATLPLGPDGVSPAELMPIEDELTALKAQVDRQGAELAQARHAIGLLEDKNEIERLQYAYGYFLDNRMFREVADLFADEGAWIEIGDRGRYFGKDNVHRFLLEVLGGGRWGLATNEVINHVQQQLLITVDEDRVHARARARAEVQGNSPPDTPHFLFADGIYENDYVKEGGRWKIEGIRVTMTFYAALERAKIWFDSAPPSEAFPPAEASPPKDARIGRQFNLFRWPHPVTEEPLAVPASDPNATDKGGGGIDETASR